MTTGSMASHPPVLSYKWHHKPQHCLKCLPNIGRQFVTQEQSLAGKTQGMRRKDTNPCYNNNLLILSSTLHCSSLWQNQVFVLKVNLLYILWDNTYYKWIMLPSSTSRMTESCSPQAHAMGRRTELQPQGTVRSAIVAVINDKIWFASRGHHHCTHMLHCTC